MKYFYRYLKCLCNEVPSANQQWNILRNVDITSLLFTSPDYIHWLYITDRFNLGHLNLDKENNIKNRTIRKIGH